MTVPVLAYEITTWSHKQFRARKNYACRNCGGLIVTGSNYLRHVERLGVRKGKDPLRNVQFHLDCQASWYQPGDLPHRLRHTGKLPGSLPPADDHAFSKPFVRPHVSISRPETGTLMWKLPAVVETKLALCPTTDCTLSAIGELEQALLIVMTALVDTVGHKRKALKLSHLLNEIANGL